MGTYSLPCRGCSPRLDTEQIARTCHTPFLRTEEGRPIDQGLPTGRCTGRHHRCDLAPRIPWLMCNHATTPNATGSPHTSTTMAHWIPFSASALPHLLMMMMPFNSSFRNKNAVSSRKGLRYALESKENYIRGKTDLVSGQKRPGAV